MEISKCLGSGCRKDASNKCPYKKCGSCCSRTGSCCEENHGQRSCPKGTGKASINKRARRNLAKVIESANRKICQNSPVYSAQLEAAGYTCHSLAIAQADYLSKRSEICVGATPSAGLSAWDDDIFLAHAEGTKARIKTRVGFLNHPFGGTPSMD